jgi:hypothetical protein
MRHTTALQQRSARDGPPSPAAVAALGCAVRHDAALADHLAPLVGKTRSTLITLLSRYDGDVERVVAPLSHRRPITFEEQASRIGRRWRNISLPACIGRSDRSRDC